jgi:hypothetical protein
MSRTMSEIRLLIISYLINWIVRLAPNTPEGTAVICMMHKTMDIQLKLINARRGK